jgi:hypothetical protein
MHHDGRGLLAGDPDAEAVLRELAVDPAPQVQGWANFGPRRMQSPDEAGADAQLRWIIRSRSAQ